MNVSSDFPFFKKHNCASRESTTCVFPFSKSTALFFLIFGKNNGASRESTACVFPFSKSTVVSFLISGKHNCASHGSTTCAFPISKNMIELFVKAQAVIFAKALLCFSSSHALGWPLTSLVHCLLVPRFSVDWSQVNGQPMSFGKSKKTKKKFHGSKKKVYQCRKSSRISETSLQIQKKFTGLKILQ